MIAPMFPHDVDVSALDDLVLGRGVRRGRHLLGTALVPLFLERLGALGFVPLPVGEIDVPVGVRVPAWLVRGEVADFGTVFWEVFHDRLKRKLFGSEVRNAKGDWEIVLPAAAREPVFAGLVHAESYDASRPVGMF